MAPISSVALQGLLMALPATGQLFDRVRSPDAFTWVQPENTTILTQYGSSEPVYPSPQISGAGGWEEAVDKARDFVAELTLEEKALMVTGQTGPCVGNIYPIPRLNFTGLCLQDGPASLRVADYVSSFEAGVTIASSWDKTMMYDRAVAMGQEFRDKGAHIALAPSVGPLGRSPYGGRNWEGFSSDPYLSGVAMELSVRGFQDMGVQATPKHWLLNEQEIMRNPITDENGNNIESISSNADDRTTHELYMWPFANAIHANAASVMCSYQRVNGSYGCQNSKILNGLLKTELGFQGYVMSDWFATHTGVAAIEAGLDMDMPGYFMPRALNDAEDHYLSYFGNNITTSVNNGTLDEARLDDMVLRIMTPYYALHQDEDFPSVDPSTAGITNFFGPEIWIRQWNLTGEASRDVRRDHGELIRKHAAASTIMVKNENNALPLKAPKRMAVFGNDAGDVTTGPINQGTYETGTLAVGGGSGAALFTYLVSPIDALKARSRQDNTLLTYWLNNTQILNSEVSDFWNPSEPDVCLVFLKSWATEVLDRETLDSDFDGNEVVEKVAKDCNNTVVVTHSAGVNMLPFADHPNVTAILLAHYPGQESGNSIADVLYGDVNPSGKMPYTIAYNASDYNAPITTNVTTNGPDDWQSWFDEKLEIDYRYFDAHDIDVRYEFGFGLSYSTFNMSDLKVSPVNEDVEITSHPEEREIQPGGNPALWETLYEAEITVKNTGDVDGATVAQLYVTFPESTPKGTPPRQLRGFDKLTIASGESQQAKFELMRRDISYWDVVSQEWVIPAGEFTLSAGFSSRDLVEVATFTAHSSD